MARERSGPGKRCLIELRMTSAAMPRAFLEPLEGVALSCRLKEQRRFPGLGFVRNKFNLGERIYGVLSCLPAGWREINAPGAAIFPPICAAAHAPVPSGVTP